MSTGAVRGRNDRAYSLPALAAYALLGAAGCGGNRNACNLSLTKADRVLSFFTGETENATSTVPTSKTIG